MTVGAIIDRGVALATDAASAIGATISQAAHAAYDAVSRIPPQHQGVAALVAAASITVTLVTLYFWPREAEVPTRETMDAAAVRRLARQGSSTADIARRTGLSHDAVATIVRAGTLTRSNAIIPARKTRPTAARSAGWLRLAGLRK